MAQIIQFKRGKNANLASLTLVAGEPAFVLDTGKLYVGDGTNKILINPDQGAVVSADKLTTAKTISLTGDVTGSISFDGSANVSITTTEKPSGVIAGTYSKVTVDAKGNVIAGSPLLASSDIPILILSKISDAGTVASKNTGTSSGNIPILDTNGKLDINILPGLALTTTNVVISQTAMLALNAEPGDLAVRTDLSKTYVLKTAGSGTLTNWQELLTPTDVVASVAGKTGVVALNASDVSLGNVTNESKATMFTSPTFTGTPSTPTATAGTNTTQVASTAFVTTAVANKTTITGNSGTATKLATTRNINGVAFDGTADIYVTIDTIDGGTF